MESRLADKEEQSMEKSLILQQVSRLTERVSTQLSAGKQDTLQLAKKVMTSILQVSLVYRTTLLLPPTE